MIGIRGNRISHAPLVECVRRTHEVAEAIASHDYERAMSLRGGSFREAFTTFRTIIRALPHPPEAGQRRLRLAVIHSGSPAPGMNTAVRAAVRHGLDRGHILLGVRNGFPGLAAGQVVEMDWMSVNGWAPRGGAELGTNRKIPSGRDYYAIARQIEEHQIEGLLIIGGWTGYQSAYQLMNERRNYPAFNIPMVCLPATINNHLPGSELSVGADTALNNIVQAVDKIKQSAVATRRVFVVEVMGRKCGYLALMSGLASGAERVYLHEEGVTLRDLQADLEQLVAGFKGGKRVGLIIRSEQANPIYTTDFMRSLFEEEGHTLFDVRQAILGHLQQGGDPSPFDRILATRLATKCVDYLIARASDGSTESAFIGLQGTEVKFHDLQDFLRTVDEENQRPKMQWWLDLRPIARVLAKPASGVPA
jgi:6-phosphofructokinase 1